MGATVLQVPSSPLTVTHQVHRLAGAWSLHSWQTPGATVAVGAGRLGPVVRIDEPDGVGTEVAAGRDGNVEVVCRCGPPAVHLRVAAPHVAIPAGGHESAIGRIAPGEVLVVPSCALLEHAPAALPALMELFADGAPDGAVRPTVVAAVDALLAAVEAPGAALAILVHLPAGAEVS